jgi:hypothetical protein
MTEQEALAKMIAPGTPRAGKWRGGVIQIWVTRACNNSCFGCTQGSNLAGKPGFITPEQFAMACESLRGYFGVVGMFGGNPAMHPMFTELCKIMREHVKPEQRGLWCNDPITVENAKVMSQTFNPAVSNLNCHLDKEAYNRFKAGWPVCMPFGMDRDSRHSPVHLAMKDLIADEGERWRLISTCDINQHWSAMIGVFRGMLRAWFCEVAGAQAMLHQDDPEYPDTGIDPTRKSRSAFTGKDQTWWRLPMIVFRDQVRKHCHECGVPLRGYGELAMDKDPLATEQTTATHDDIFKLKRKDRRLQLVATLEQLGTKRVKKVTDYLGNATGGKR